MNLFYFSFLILHFFYAGLRRFSNRYFHFASCFSLYHINIISKVCVHTQLCELV